LPAMKFVKHRFDLARFTTVSAHAQKATRVKETLTVLALRKPKLGRG
jgi:hypothetical protein